MSEELYLKRNVMVEPLIDQWYAWTHIVSPATAAMNIVGRHLRIMESYVAAPEAHRSAAANPEMAGGPFVDYRIDRSREIAEVIEETRRTRAPMLELAEAISQLDAMLRDNAEGFSLESLYTRVPDPLKGYVELVYDLNSQPSFRLIEPLLYRSRYYNPSTQSLMLSTIHEDWRPFVMSTPRLPEEGKLHLRLPMAHSGIDELFRMKRSPRPYDFLKECLELRGEDEAAMRSFLTPEPPLAYVPYLGRGIRWRYFGHACMLIEAAGVSILLDPVLSYTYEHDISRYTYDDLPETIDYVLITHNHQDHILLETMLQLRHKVKTIVVPRCGGGDLADPSLTLMFRELGFPSVIDLGELDQIQTATGAITALPFLGEHADLDIRSKAAWLVEIHGTRLLFAADSCNLESRMYDHLHELTGDVDALFLGMECDGAPLSWIYGPLLTQRLNYQMDQSRRLAGSNYERGIEIVNRLGCREVYVYAMGQEPWLNHVMRVKYTDESQPIVASNRLVKECIARGIPSERLFGEKEILVDTAQPTGTGVPRGRH